MAEMMTDRELLELAAKSAGLQLCGYCWVSDNEDDDECSVLESVFVKHHPRQELATTWNPLTDDGDALRLAVNIGMRVYVYTEDLATTVGFNLPGGDRKSIHNPHGIDAAEATRRAIVLAAAEIGKGV